VALLRPAATHACHSPIPTPVISNGEFMPAPQNARERQLEACIGDLADALAPATASIGARFLGLPRTGLPAQ